MCDERCIENFGGERERQARSAQEGMEGGRVFQQIDDESDTL
jgi:hypothetical protein